MPTGYERVPVKWNLIGPSNDSVRRTLWVFSELACHARVQIGDSHSHSIINNYQHWNPKLADSHLAETDNERLRIAFLRRLHTSPYEDRKNRNPKRVDGTCEWFTTHNRFQNWQAEASAMLWVSADPGCGKSVLAKYLVDDVIASNTTRTTCYFFFKDDFDDQKTLESALCCILHQLFIQKPDLLLDKFLDGFREEGGQLFSSFDGLWRTLIESVGQHKHGEIICILDALDECREHKRLAAALTKLYNKGKGISTLNFLVTSRPYLNIGREFQDLKDSQPTIHLRGENPEEVDRIAQEIILVIERRIEELGKRHQLPMDEMQILHDEITAINHRTYLWVHLIFAALEEAVFLSKAELRAKIHELPHTVEEAYDGILQRSSDPEKARKILRIVVAAERPLRLTEMAAALAFRGSHRCHQDLEQDVALPDRLQIAIREICGLFVVVKASEIFLIHQTAREFLVRIPLIQPEISSTLKWQYSSIQKSRTFCFQKYALARVESLDVFHFCLLEYAASNWAYHYRQAHSKPGANLERLVLQLCNVQLPACQSWLLVYGERRMGDPGFMRELPTSLLIASYFGLNKLVGSVLREGKSRLDARGARSQRTALSWASEKGYVSTVELLLGQVHTIHVFFRDWSSSLSSIVNRRDQHGRTPLLHAAANGHLKIVQLLLSKSAKVDIRDENGLTPLTWATYHGYRDIVALLLENGARQKSGRSHLETRDRKGRTPLMNAARDGNEAVVKMLLDGGAKVDPRDTNGRRALQHAAIGGNDTIVKLLLDRGDDIHIKDKFDYVIALMRASGKGYTAVVELLLDRAADIDIRTKDRWDAHKLALMGNHDDVAKLLLERGSMEH
ncbi:hypothetical protein PG994_009650 [Apiospora phragmitis]|uniref:Uncharacterized protein n=1 Tax=Apiospora phragmitis TaxID=2905665 RepID=A0ABR1U6P5_9PEZI